VAAEQRSLFITSIKPRVPLSDASARVKRDASGRPISRSTTRATDLPKPEEGNRRCRCAERSSLKKDDPPLLKGESVALNRASRAASFALAMPPRSYDIIAPLLECRCNINVCHQRLLMTALGVLVLVAQRRHRPSKATCTGGSFALSLSLSLPLLELLSPARHYRVSVGEVAKRSYSAMPEDRDGA